MTAGRRAAATLATGAALLALAWCVGPRSAPPLYDGGPIVAEHYRYLHPPAGFTNTKPPGTVDVTLKLEGGQSPAIAELTDEQPSQAQLLAAQGAFTVPPGATGVRLTVGPVEPPTVAPAGGGIAGNVYRFAVTAMPGATPMPLRTGQQITVVLRGPAGVANPTLEVWDGARWNRAETTPLGSSSPDSYAANLTMLGDMALVTPQVAPAADSGGGGGAGLIIAAVVVAVVLVSAATVLVLRRR
jgi:hypothetical protein